MIPKLILSQNRQYQAEESKEDLLLEKIDELLKMNEKMKKELLEMNEKMKKELEELKHDLSLC